MKQMAFPNRKKPERSNSGLASLKSEYAIAYSVLLILFAFPFLFFPLIPATDLPQHISQIRLLLDQLARPDGNIFIGWYSPNVLVYFIILFFWQIVSPVMAGNLTLYLLILAGTGAIFFYAYRLQRPVETALLASLFMWNLNLNWGFFNFLLGWPFFLLWLMLFPSNPRTWRWFALALLAYCLLWSHALWFMVTCFWSAVYLLFQKRRWLYDFWRLSTLLPAGIYSLVWFPRLSSLRRLGGFQLSPRWANWPWERLVPHRLVDQFFGNIRGPVEGFLLFLVFMWLVLSFLTHRKNLRKQLSPVPLSAAFTLFGIGLLAPDFFMNTLYFAARWMPWGLALLMLAMPVPRIDRFFRLSFASVLLLSLLVATSAAWHGFNRLEMKNFMTLIDQLNSQNQLLQLDFEKTSSYVKGRPFLQSVAYFQAVKDGEIQFSFLQHGNGIVSYKRPIPSAWNNKLDWQAESLKINDLYYFDRVMVQASDSLHTRLAAHFGLIPVTLTGRWRLYRIEADSIRALDQDRSILDLYR
ncbi:hypothetical protein JW992_15430 [candidate division KSB1 bacterium]|nr:hypothetical protein [candidate division KSB1 bacterium]